jgi:transcriptional regulator with GAF, ATPase, and Fis domain
VHGGATGRVAAGVDGGEVAGPGGLVGRHPSMLGVYKTIGAVSASRAAVLLRGETGTGRSSSQGPSTGTRQTRTSPSWRELCCGSRDPPGVHPLRPRSGGLHGASADRRGPFELAGRGTIFLDEIGDTSLALQAKLLRVLEEREFYPVGSEHPRRTEARVITATNRDLEDLVGRGSSGRISSSA